MKTKRSEWMKGLLQAEELIKDGFAPLWVEQEYFYDEENDYKHGVFSYLSYYNNNLKNLGKTLDF